MPEIKILSVKLLKGAEKLEVRFNQTLPVAGSDGFTGNNRPHPDLVNKLQALTVHLAVMGAYIKPKDVKKASLEKFVVTSYHYTIKEESEKVKILGYILTENGASFINPPRYSITADEDSDYPLIQDLINKLADIDAEVIAYLDGKKAPDPQTSLFPDEEGELKVTRIQVLDSEEEENNDDEEFPEDEEPVLEKPKGGKGHLPQADREAMKRVRGEWSPEEYAKEIGKAAALDEHKEKTEAKKRGRKVTKKSD